jgi:hypothetical protein
MRFRASGPPSVSNYHFECFRLADARISYAEREPRLKVPQDFAPRRGFFFVTL